MGRRDGKMGISMVRHLGSQSTPSERATEPRLNQHAAGPRFLGVQDRSKAGAGREQEVV